MKKDILEQFEQIFHHRAEVYSRAPGRLEILGNHTDYNQGFVLSCAVGQSVYMALAARPGRISRLANPEFDPSGIVSFSLDEIGAARPGDWTNYIKGVIVELRKKGLDVGAFDCLVASTLPPASGMSSSAALETAAGFAFAELFNLKLAEKSDWARVGQAVENDYLGLKTGLLDQFSSIFGRENALILSDFRSVEVLRTVTLPKGYSLIVANSMVKHNLVDSEYNSRRIDCESATRKIQAAHPEIRTLRDVSPELLTACRPLLTLTEYRRAMHITGECDRVLKAVAALDAGEVETFGKLLFESHESSRMNFENSTVELDMLVELAHSIPGCLGSRLSGGGFGGISIHLVKTAEAESYGKRLQTAFQLQTGVTMQVIICEIGDGAHAEKLNR